MRVITLFLVFIAITTGASAQLYVAFNPSVTNSAGTLAEKANLSLEFGMQYDVFSAGFDIGKTSLGKKDGLDTTNYIEFRPNLNIFQQGKFTNTFTAGIGVIFNAEENLMTELSSTIEYAYSPLIHYNIIFGQYYYSGRTDASSVTFFGISGMLYFSSSKSAPLIIRKP